MPKIPRCAESPVCIRPEYTIVAVLQIENELARHPQTTAANAAHFSNSDRGKPGPQLKGVFHFGSAVILSFYYIFDLLFY